MTDIPRPGLDERVALMRAFHRRGNDRALLGFFRGSEYPLRRYPFAASLPEGRPLQPGDFDVDAFAADCERLFLEHEECGGDLIYAASAFWGIPWLEAALGCPIVADQATGSISSHLPAAGARIAADFDPDAPWPRLMGDMLAALRARSAGRFPLATTRMRGIADLLAAIYGNDALVYAMVDRPQEVADLAGRLTSFFIACAAFQIERIPPFRGGIGSFYYHLWAPAGTVWYQEDAAALLSPGLYRRFIEPCDRRVVAAFPSVAMHQHSTGFVPTRRYLDMGMALLEMHIDAGGPGAERLCDRHREILAERPLLVWGRLSDRDLEWLLTRLPARGLAISAAVDGPAEAVRIQRLRRDLAAPVP